MTTREAFEKMITQREIYKSLGIAPYTVRRYRLNIKGGDWPNSDTMDELLQKAGWKVVQEKLWEEKKKK